MSHPVIESAQQLAEQVFLYEVGTPGFNVSVGVCAFVWLIVARVLTGMFSSKRGILSSFFALSIPLVIALVAYGMAELHLVPMVDLDWAKDWIPFGGFGLLLLMSVMVVAKRIWQLSAGVALFIYIVASTASVGAYFGVQVTMGVIEFGEEQVEQRDQKVKDGIESLL